MSWTDERVERLRKLWLDGMSASQIANDLGGGVTRNAVIGKVHRLGLSGRGQPTAAVKRTRRAQPHAPRKPRQTHSYVGALALKAEASLAPVAVMRPRHDVVVPIAKRLTIEKLTEHTCKWPIGDPGLEDFHFCGHDSLDGLPYCEYHAGVAYQAPDRSRRVKRVMYG